MATRLETSVALFDRVFSTLPAEDVEAFANAVVHRFNAHPALQQHGHSHSHSHGHDHDHCGCGHDHGHEHAEQKPEDVLEQVQRALREMVPVSAEAPEEADGKCLVPAGAAAAARRTTVHVDAFLYDDADVDDLVAAGAMSRNYCTACGSHRVAPLDFVSHSASRAQLQFMFSPAMLLRGAAARDRLRGLTVVDVGSRLGAVLYAAWALTDAKEIVGVESSAWWCRIQREIVGKRFPAMAPRVRVVEADVRAQAQLLARADVVVLNNPFEFFVDSVAKELELWHALRRCISKRGAKIVTLPSLEETFARLGKGVMEEIGFAKWVRPLAVEYPPAAADHSDGDAGESLRGLHLYVVL